MNETEISERVLEFARKYTGLWIDADAIEPTGNEERRIANTRIIRHPDGGLAACISNTTVCGLCREHRASVRGTAVLINSRQGRARVASMATSGHCCPPDSAALKHMRMIVNLPHDISSNFRIQDVIAAKSVLHYESFDERDVAIVRMETTRNDALPLPAENTRVGRNDRVYIVGHDGGRPLAIYPANVTRVTLGQKPTHLRAFEVTTDRPTMSGLSGSPVFRATHSKDPELLGIVQKSGPAEVNGYPSPPEHVIEDVLRALMTDRQGFLTALQNRVFKQIDFSTVLPGLLATSAAAPGRPELDRWLDAGLAAILGANAARDASSDTDGGAAAFGRTSTDFRLPDERKSSDAQVVFLGGALSASLYPRSLSSRRKPKPASQQ